MDQFITHPVMAVTKRELEQLLLKAMVECNWTFNQFGSPSFKNLIGRGFPHHEDDIPGPTKMKKLLSTEAINARNDIRERITSNSSRVSLALDNWTSSNGIEFMGAYFVIKLELTFSNNFTLC